ncbi:MAG: hypothetical protein ACJ72D_26790 [Marmoricola sp.]
MLLSLVVLAAIVAGLVVLVKRMRSSRWVSVGEQVPLAHAPTDLPGRLAALGTGRVITPAPDRAALVLRRAPVWTVLPALLLFPVGLLFLLYREDVALEVTPDPGGAFAWLSGRTEARTLAAVKETLATA